MAFFLSHFRVKHGGETTPPTMGTSCLDTMHLEWKQRTSKVPGVSSRCYGRVPIPVGHSSHWLCLPGR